DVKLSRVETLHGEFSRAAGVPAGGSRHPGLADEVAPQRHRISRHRVRRRRRQPSAPFTRRQVEEPAVEVDPSRTLLGRFLNMEHYERLKGIGLLVATQMSESSEKLKNLSLYLLGAIFAVYAMELCVMPSRNVIISRIASNSTKLLSFYLLLCILKPDWLSSCRFVIVCIIAIACTCFDELNVTSQNASALYQYIKIKLTWCCEKSVMVISYVIDKVLTSRNDQASPASAPPHASV
ncbi:hypothetical protein Tco_0646838, partial [Tanacetum coccineum]